MVDYIKSIAMATLANLSRAEDGDNRTFSINQIATRAAQLFSLEYNDLRKSLKEYLAGAATSGQDNHIGGDPYHEFYMLTDAGQSFQAKIVAAAAVNVPTTSTKPSSSSLHNHCARDDDDADLGSDRDGDAASTTQHNSATKKPSSSSSSSSSSCSQSSGNLPSANNNQQSSRPMSKPPTGTNYTDCAHHSYPNHNAIVISTSNITNLFSGPDCSSIPRQAFQGWRQWKQSNKVIIIFFSWQSNWKGAQRFGHHVWPADRISCQSGNKPST